MFRTVLCAALLFPVFEQTQFGSQPNTLTEPSSSSVKQLVMDDLAVDYSCALLKLEELGGGQCAFLFEHCPTGFWYLSEAPCDTPEIGCDCNAPLATVRLPDVDGRQSHGMASAGPAFAGIPVAADAFAGSQLPEVRTSDAFTLVHDEAVNVRGRAFRIRSLVHNETQRRFDYGYELVGVGAEALGRYRVGQLRTVFGNDMQADIKVGGNIRLFHLIGVGESAVPSGNADTPLIPVPDSTVPAASDKPSLD